MIMSKESKPYIKTFVEHEIEERMKLLKCN